MVNQAAKRQESIALEAILREYVQTSTIAGLHYAFDRTQPKFGQALWLVIVVILTAIGIFSSVQSYIDWDDDQVVTTISSTGTLFKSIKQTYNKEQSPKVHFLQDLCLENFSVPMFPGDSKICEAFSFH